MEPAFQAVMWVTRASLTPASMLPPEPNLSLQDTAWALGGFLLIQFWLLQTEVWLGETLFQPVKVRI